MTTINTPDAVPNELITASWGDAVRGDLQRLNTTKLELTGGTMTGMLRLPSTNPTNADHAARKGYVDAQVATSVRDNVTANQTMKGALTAPYFVATANPLPTGGNVVVNREVLNAGLANKINRDGDTMGGVLTLSADIPTGARAAMPRSWISEQVGTRLSLSGGTMNGVINMGGSRITNMGDPANAQDAATRAWCIATFQQK